MNTYEKRQADRKERFQLKSGQATDRSNQLHGEAKGMADRIPFGQPILVGHHSEKRDRNFRGKITRKFEKSFEESNKAQHYARKAAGVGKAGISSDDPEAVQKLQAKIDSAERSQEAMKAINKIVKSKPKDERTDEKISQLLTTYDGMSTERAEKLFIPDSCGRVGFASYCLTNNNANIRRMKERLKVLGDRERVRQHFEEEGNEPEAVQYEGFEILENHEENRVQILFNSKEDYTKIKDRGINLRSLGWKYSKTNSAWQRHLNNAGKYAAEYFVQLVTK